MNVKEIIVLKLLGIAGAVIMLVLQSIMAKEMGDISRDTSKTVALEEQIAKEVQDIVQILQQEIEKKP